MVFSGITIVSKGNSTKKSSRGRNDKILLINGNAETNMPLQKISLSLWAEREDCYFENKALKQQDTLLRNMHD